METMTYTQMTIFDDFEMFELESELYTEVVEHVETEIRDLINRNYLTGDQTIVLAGRLQFWNGSTFGYKKVDQQILNNVAGDCRNIITINDAGELEFQFIHHDGTHVTHLYVVNEDDYECANNESVDSMKRLIYGLDPIRVDNEFRNEFGFDSLLTLEDVIDKLPDYDNGFYTMVVEDISDFDTIEDAKMYLSDVSQFGCISGTVTRFIYTNDIRKAFIEHSEDCFDILEGADIDLSHFDCMASFLQAIVWTSYEVMASRILDDLIDIESEVV